MPRYRCRRSLSDVRWEGTMDVLLAALNGLAGNHASVRVDAGAGGA